MTFEGENEIARHPIALGRTLIWRDEGSPYDNALHVYLLASDGSVVDAIEAGASLTVGLLEIHNVDTTGVDFSFYKNDQCYRLSVSDSLHLRLPFHMPIGFRYKSMLTRHLLSISVL